MSVSAEGRVFTSRHHEEYSRDGFTVIKGLFSAAATSSMLSRLEGLIASWDLHKLRSESKPFVTNDQANRSSDEWFLTSGDAVRPFFEEEGDIPVVNKIGHALHELDPLFRQVLHSKKIEEILRGVGYEQPVPVQSMYIAKSAKVGGEVTAHQDNTFLVSDPFSVCGIWIALKKATVENGCMFFVKGSHLTQPVDRLFLRDESDSTRTVFTPLNPPPYNVEGAVAVEADVGDAVVFHGSVVHYSAPNRSNIHRPAYVMHFSEQKCGWHPRNWLRSRFFQPLYGSLLSELRIPVIDLSRVNADTERAWDLAMSEYGCAVVVGHSIDPVVVHTLKRLMKEFFSKSEPFKNKFVSGGYGLSGYNSFATEAVADVNKVADPIESFYLKQDANFSSSGDIQDLLTACDAYRDAMDKHLLFPLLKLSARALGVKDEDALVKAHKDHFRTLKLSHYPGRSTSQTAQTNHSRYGAHTDWVSF